VTVTTFQRARSEEQRAARRSAILAAAAGMLAEMPVADVTLNELARRTGLAKSNVLRYFESREAVLLELLDDALSGWLDELRPLLRNSTDPAATLFARIDSAAAAVAESLAGQPVLCDLVGAQAAVLERNVSPAVAARYKRATVAKAAELGEAIAIVVPEIHSDALVVGGAVTLTAGAIWSHSHPSPAMLQAYAADPELAALRLDFVEAERQLLAVLLTGLVTRRSARS
jgi:AcrR family transcriptional regulator